MKLLIITDIHNGKSREYRGTGVYRQANTQAMDRLRETIPLLAKQDFDLLIQLGDLISDEMVEDVDRANMRAVLSELHQLPFPKIHIPGNHDYAIPREILLEEYAEAGFEDQFIGIQEVGGKQLVWLDFEFDENSKAYLPHLSLEWLEKEVDPELETIVFSHYSIAPLNAAGSFYFDEATGGRPKDMRYTNSDQILEILGRKNVIACVNGHAHWSSYKHLSGIHFFGAPSFSENLAGQKYPENNHGLYSVLEIENDKLTFKSFSGEFAFSSLEL